MEKTKILGKDETQLSRANGLPAFRSAFRAIETDFKLEEILDPQSPAEHDIQTSVPPLDPWGTLTFDWCQRTLSQEALNERI